MPTSRIGAALLFAALLLTGCDNTVHPLADDPPAYFAIAGYLDADADTQFVRVDALRATVQPGVAPLDAVVTTQEDVPGERIVWQDSLVRLQDGAYGHLFYAPFRPVPGRRYTLSVTGSDGRTTTAATRVPPPLPIEVGAVVDTAGRAPYQAVTWRGLRRAPETVVVRYLIRAPDATAVDTFAWTYAPLGQATPRGLAFEVYLARDRALILDRLGREREDSSLVLVELQMAIRQLSEAWYHTGEGSDIQAGFGFFGSASTTSAAWTLDATAAAQVGFQVEESGAAAQPSSSSRTSARKASISRWRPGWW